MSIVSVSKMWSRDSVAGSISDDKKTRTAAFREGWQVVTSADATQAEVLAASGLPQPGQVLAGAAAIFVRRVVPSRVSPILWIVDVEYSGEYGPGGPNDHPASNLPEIEWTDATTNEEISIDVDGKAIVTACGEPIYGVTKEVNDPVLSVVRNFRTFDSYLTSIYRDSVSSDVFMGWPAGTARLTKYKAKQIVDNAGIYWKVSATIQFRRPFRTTADKAWHARVRHEGLYELLDGQIVRAVDALGQFVQKPVLLKEDGSRETDINAAYFKLIPKYTPLPYTALGLV